MSDNLVFLFDVDNTLLDNDRVAADLRAYLETTMGHERQEHYWSAFEELRGRLGYADYLGALQQYRVNHPHDTQILKASHFLLEYPFAERLYPGALEAVRHASRLGSVVILSDGDVVFQPHKVWRSGLYDAFGGAVLIYIHKELELEDVERRHPAAHYVLVDDKVRILAAVKNTWGARVTTVFPRQGHYALDDEIVRAYPAPDVTVERIGELVQVDFSG